MLIQLLKNLNLYIMLRIFDFNFKYFIHWQKDTKQHCFFEDRWRNSYCLRFNLAIFCIEAHWLGFCRYISKYEDSKFIGYFNETFNRFEKKQGVI